MAAFALPSVEGSGMSPPAPSQPIDPYSRYSFNDLLTCIREQQAALKEAIEEADACHDDEHGTPSPNLDVARAVLTKWRIE